MNICYADARRYPVPHILTPEAVAGIKARSIDLADLGRRYCITPQGGRNPILRPSATTVPLAGVRFNEWVTAFPESARCHVSAVADPADTYGQEPALCVVFDEPALLALNEAVRAALPAAAPQALMHWTLTALHLRVLPNSPLFDVVVEFDASSGAIPPGQWDAASAALTKPIDECWPIWFAILDRLWVEDCAGRPRHDASQSWDNDLWPFGQPRRLREMGRKEFDPSDDYQYDAILIVAATEAELTGLIADIDVRFTRAADLPDESEIHISQRAWTIIRNTRRAPAGTEEVAGFGANAKAILGIVLIGLVLKFESFNQRVYATLLNEVSGGRLRLTAKRLRGFVYRTELLRIELAGRTVRLAEPLRQVYDAWSDSCKLNEETRRSDRLANLMLSAAEGMEAAEQQKFEHQVQKWGLFFVGFSVLTLVYDLWNFSWANLPDQGERLRPLRVTFGIAALIVAILVFKRFAFRQRDPEGPDHG
jgi:hypothetical protein